MCGGENPTNATFCINCGEKIAESIPGTRVAKSRMKPTLILRLLAAACVVGFALAMFTQPSTTVIYPTWPNGNLNPWVGRMASVGCVSPWLAWTSDAATTGDVSTGGIAELTSIGSTILAPGATNLDQTTTVDCPGIIAGRDHLALTLAIGAVLLFGSSEIARRRRPANALAASG